MRKMVTGQDKSDPDDDADDESGYETKPGSIADGTLAQGENSRRLVLVHGGICTVVCRAQLQQTRSLFFNPRNYTAIARGGHGTTGLALVAPLCAALTPGLSESVCH